MKKYLLILIFSFLLITPVLAFDSGTEFSITFTLPYDNNTLVSYDTGEDDALQIGYSEYVFLGGFSECLDITEETINSGTNNFAVVYEDQEICLYVNGSLINCNTECNLDDLTYNDDFVPETTTNLLVYDYALTLEEIILISNGSSAVPAFVGEMITDVSSSSVAFLGFVINDYWLVILGVFFVSFMIGLFWRLAHRITGKN